jgi:hypothetical protein
MTNNFRYCCGRIFLIHKPGQVTGQQTPFLANLETGRLPDVSP